MDKLLGGVMVMFFVLFASLVLYLSVFQTASTEQTIERQEYEQVYYARMFQAVLESSEPNTNSSYDSLISMAIARLDSSITVRGEQLDVDDSLENVFDELIGQNQYFLNISLPASGLAVSFVFDGSETMREERETVRNNIDGIVRELQDILDDAMPEGEEANVEVFIYGLDDPTTNVCGEFSGLDCTSLTAQELYGFLVNHGLEPPIVNGYDSFAEWETSSHAASASALSASDWASGVVYAHMRMQEDPDLALTRATTNLHIVVTVADELASSSKADECFRLQQGQDTNVCMLCKESCPENRSLQLVQQANSVLNGTNGLFVVGLYTSECDFSYDSAWSSWNRNGYRCQFADDPSICAPPNAQPGWWEEVPPLAPINWCDQTACGACQSASPSYCYHSACGALIPDHMQIMTQGIGEVLPLTDVDQLVTLVPNITSEIIGGFEFSAGRYLPNRDRYVFERPISLANGQQIDVQLLVYD